MEPSTRVLKGLRYENTSEVRYITTHQESHFFDVAETREELVDKLSSFTLPSPELDIDLVSDQKKILFKVDDSFYHFFIDSLPVILKIHREHPDVSMVLFLQTARRTVLGNQLIELLKTILSGEGVNHTLVEIASGLDHSPILKICNHSTAGPYFDGNNFTSFVDILISTETVIRYAKQKLGITQDVSAPDKKVFLSSESHKGWHLDIGDGQEYSGYLDDARMNNKEELEDFFRSIGYEVIDPTKKFRSLYEQIIYMTSVKTLAAVTCSGLGNMIFMNPRQLVVEIQAEVVQNLPNPPGFEGSTPMQGVHTMYPMISFMKDHSIVCIPSHRNPDEVIQTIKNSNLIQLIG